MKTYNIQVHGSGYTAASRPWTYTVPFQALPLLSVVVSLLLYPSSPAVYLAAEATASPASGSHPI